MATVLQLIGDKKGFIDIDDNTAFPLNFGISEIKDLSVKRGTFSKTITMKGTKNNIKIFGFLHDINVRNLGYGDYQFDINELTYIDVIEDGVCILPKMLLQLTGLTKKQTNNKYEDEVTFTGLIKDSTSDLFSTLNNKILGDLDFSDMNHVYTAENVIKSWSNTWNTGFTDDLDGTLKKGFKYVMPFNPEVQDDIQFRLAEFLPGIYARNYFDKIFNSASYSYYWPTMDDEDIQFSKLVIPYNGDVPTTGEEESETYRAQVERITEVTTLESDIWAPQQEWNEYLANGSSSLDIPIVIEDPEGDYNATFSYYLTPDFPSVGNNLKYTYEVDYEVYVDNQDDYNVAMQGGYRYFDTHPQPGSDFYTFDIAPKITFNLYGVPENQGGLLDVDYIAKDGIIKIANNTVFPANSITMLESGTAYKTKVLFGLTPGMKVRMSADIDFNNRNGGFWYNFYRIGGVNYPDTNIKYKVKGIRAKINSQLEGEYGFNVPLKMNKLVPKDFKQSDFLKSIFTMYNLYCEVDKDNPNRINIIPRDKYYDDGKVVDWSKKIDPAIEQDIQFLPEVSNRYMLLTYQESNDYANEVYTAATSEIYGQLKYDFGNKYVKDIKKYEISFGPTPMFKSTFGAVTPMFNGQAPNSEPKILIDGGTYSCGPYRIYNNDTNYIESSIYPHINHWDKPENPTFDLNFGVCKYYFRADDYGSITNNNLFNLHWRRTANQIATGRLMTANFNLTPYDILKLKLNDKIFITNSWWNINKVIDYDANNKKSTKVELITIDDGLKVDYPIASPQLLQRNNKIFRAINQNTKDRDLYLNTILSNGNVDVKGRDNFVGANVNITNINGNNNTVTKDSFINGNNNTSLNGGVIFGNNNNVQNNSTVFGNDNTISGTATGIVIFGNNINATQSGTLYTNNIYISDGGTINGVTISNILNASLESLRKQNNILEGELIIATAFPGFGTGTFSLNQTGFTMSNNSGYNYNTPFTSRIGYHSSGDSTSRTAGYYRIYNEFYNSTTTLYTNALTWNDMDNVVTKQLFFTGSNTANYYMPDKTLGNYVLATLDDITGGSGVTGPTGATGSQGIQGVTGATGATGFGFTASGLEKITEGGNTGWRLIGRNAANFGDIGSQAVDFINSTGASTTRGVLSTSAVGFGQNNSIAANAPYSIITGANNAISGGGYGLVVGGNNNSFAPYCVVTGNNNSGVGDYSSVFGQFGSASCRNEMVIGAYSELLGGDKSNVVAEDTVFRIGVGSDNLTDRRDGFRVYKNGMFWIMPATQSDVTNGLTGSIFFNKISNNLMVYKGGTWSSVTMEPIIDTTTTALSKATLNSTYPNVPPGQKVHAKDIIIGGGLIYEKTGGTDWLSYPVLTVT